MHPTGALLFAPFHSQLTLLQHLCIQLEYSKKPFQLLSDVPKYWLEGDGTMCLDDDHRWRSISTLRWLHFNGLSSVPRSIKTEIRTLVQESDIEAQSLSLWRCLLHCDAQFCPVPMSRRPNREYMPLHKPGAIYMYHVNTRGAAYSIAICCQEDDDGK